MDAADCTHPGKPIPLDDGRYGCVVCGETFDPPPDDLPAPRHPGPVRQQQLVEAQRRAIDAARAAINAARAKTPPTNDI